MNLRVLGAAVTAGLALAIAAVATGGLAPPARAGSARPAISSPQRGFLINGDPVLAAGGTSGAIVPAASSGPAGSVITLGLDGQVYRIPAAAVPYLGRGLDLSLFDESTLLASETAGRLPVTLSYRGPAPTPPGVVITSSGHGTASGYLTASSAKTFGAALDKQYTADHAKGSYGTDGMFADVVSIELAGSPPAAAVRPDYVMHTLTVNATNPAGEPDTGDFMALLNVDNSNLSNAFDGPTVFYDGTAKYSVPAGHYFALGFFQGTGGTTYLTVLPQFTVAAKGNTTISMTARSATSKIRMVTPLAAASQGGDFYIVRTSAKAQLSWAEVTTNSPILVSPTKRKPTLGTLQAYADQVLTVPPGQGGIPYSYEVSFTDPPGIVSDQRYRVRKTDLATVHENYYQSVPSSGTWIMLGSFPTNNQQLPFIGFVNPVSVPISLPGQQTVYVGGNNTARMVWTSDYYASNGDYQGYEPQRRLRAGAQLTDNWGAYPLHPAPNAMLYRPKNLFGLTPVSAARNGNTLWLDVTPFSDNQSGHLGIGFFSAPGLTASGSYRVDENGKQVAAGNAVTAAAKGAGDVPVQATVSPRPGTVKFELTASLSGQAFALSTTSQTVWTWRSKPVTGAKLPANWICAALSLNTTPSPDCAVQPMMTLDYGVAGLGLDGAAPAGRQVLDVTAGHIEPASNTKITGARVWVSFDGGSTWRAASVTRTSADKFLAVFNAPAGARVTLRTRATDAAGGSIAETVTSAYAIAS